MRKYKISVAALLIAVAALSMQSCIGSFSLTNSVLSWNKNVGNKFVNELVFIAFWILPVYEVTSIADLLILNSIEFWSGRNPMEASVKTISTDQGEYIVVCDGKGYVITNKTTGAQMELSFNEKTQTWNYLHDGKEYPFMTFIDDNHVKMVTPDGSFKIVELSQAGVQAYKSLAPEAASAINYAIR